MKIFQSVRLLIFLVGMMAFFSLVSPYFLSLENLAAIFVQSAILIVTAMGMTLVIATGGIDLSCGAILALSGIICAAAMKSGMGSFSGIIIGLFSGAVMGILNAVMIAGLSISPFIVTLGSAGIYRAIALILTDARPIYGLLPAFRFLGNGWIGPVPVSGLMSLIVMGLGYLVISWTDFGTYARAIGNNEKGAFRSGISIIKVRLGIYALAGISAALAGIMMAGRLNTAEAIAGLGIELEAIAAVIIGGTRFSGGEASMAGSLLGALIIGTLANGLTMINVPSYYQQLAIGIVFMLAVLSDQFRRPGRIPG